MDVTQQVDSIVENLVRGIEVRLEGRVEEAVSRYLENQLLNYDYESKLNWLASLKLDSMISQIEINKHSVEKRLDAVSDVVISNIETECKRLATDSVRSRLGDIDVIKTVRDIVSQELLRHVTDLTFPEHSIPGTAVDPTGLNLSGNNVSGGIIKDFNSDGIQDASTRMQMTITDEGVIVENRMVTLGLEVKGTTVLEGDIIINGNVPPSSKFYTSIIDTAVEGVKNSMDNAFFGDYSTVIFEKIKTEGLDLNRITLNGTEVIMGNKLNYGIIDTNIQRVGQIKDLQTAGETLLSETLYVGKDRVGIGTIEPNNSLSIWDQEIELGFGKRLKDTGWIGTPRRQDLVLSANGQDNLTLTADGSVEIKRLVVGKVAVISAPGVPGVEMPKGTVAFNENPEPGQPIGWVSLGGGAWSKFGTVD